MQPIISIENVGKQYKIGSQQPYLSLRDSLAQTFNPMVKRPPKNEFWALQKITFDINPGESLGVIGRNGAGKSTLLKVLSQITPPTTGRVNMRGRVASLLEVGTGFHPELTGRENIYLNGAILGMSRVEIKSKFDEIVEFAGVEKFLDTPVKRYSSGMYVRLAFAVAAHLEPEILIIDEVLAVGDAEFQKKCLGKMEQVTKQDGRTILFVSHNLPSVQSLCKKTVLLENGKVKKIGPTNEVIDAYLNDTSTKEAAPAQRFQLETKGNKGDIRFTEISLSNIEGSGSIKSSDGLKIALSYDSTIKNLAGARVIISIVSETTQQILLRMDSDVAAVSLKNTLQPHGQIVCQTGPINLLSGRYLLNLDLLIGEENKLHMESVSPFEVETDIKKYHFKAYPDKYATDHLVTYNFKQN